MPAEVERARRLFTRKEYHCMGDAGILKPTERVELIRGEIIEMSPIGPRHVAFVNNLTQLLVTRLGGRAIVSVQNPVALDDDTEPEPWIAAESERLSRHLARAGGSHWTLPDGGRMVDDLHEAIPSDVRAQVLELFLSANSRPAGLPETAPAGEKKEREGR